MFENNPRIEYSKTILKHYFNLLSKEACGRELDSECQGEIDAAIDDLVKGIIAEVNKQEVA